MSNILANFLILFIIYFTSQVQSSPYEAYPINKQLPPIARINESFEFVISNDTYKSSVHDYQAITYKAYNLPTWLQFDTDSRVLSGTPSSEMFKELTADILYFNIILEGTDPSDNVKLNNTYQLVVTNYTSFQVAQDFNLLALLKNYGNTNGKSGLIVSPNEVFNITFERSDFDLLSSDATVAAYYGRSNRYHAPLPNWISFDENNLKFSGIAPVVNSQIAPEYSYDFSFIVSDIEGFSGAEIPFSIVVGAHSLTTSVQNTILINVTDTGSFNYDIPLDYIYLDNELVKKDNISLVQLIDAPSWVSLNDYKISGVLPSESPDSSNDTFSAAIYDIFGDAIYLNFEVLLTDSLFAINSLPNVNATQGTFFQYNFLPSQFTDYANTDISIIPTNSTQDSSWLSFNQNNLTLSGNVPEKFNNLDLSVVAKKGEVTDNLTFNIDGVSKTINITSSKSLSSSRSSSSSSHSSTHLSSTLTSISTSQASSTLSPTISSSASTSVIVNGFVSKKTTNKKTVAIACGVAIPIGIIVILVLIFIFWRRNNKKEKEQDKEYQPNTDGPAIKPYSPNSETDNPFTDKHSNNGAGGFDNYSSSESSSYIEKGSSSDSTRNSIYHDANNNPSREMLLGNLDNYSSDNLHDNNRSSSLYLNDEPAVRKSWRYTKNGLADITENNPRQSMLSLNTVSTEELMNTEISSEGAVEKDPRKSSLGLRDSVFGSKSSVYSSRNSATKSVSTRNLLPAVIESSNNSNPFSDHLKTDNIPSPSTASSSSDEFIPVQQGERFNWVQKNADKPNRKPSKKRLVCMNDTGKINIRQGLQYEGHTAEQL